jgi:lipopolysaccharide/colanic/teichoic acid biosynthesis glycosyltransferase
MLYKDYLKRFFDLIGSMFILLLTLPFLIFISIILYLLNDGKIFFIQPRPGLNGQIFNIVKFKTMNDKKDSNGVLLPDNERLTSFGKYLRKWSIDELPQLVNVIKGELSFVGPRPLLIEYLKLYNEKQRKRHCVRPGITGWAQINGRNTISWNEKFEYDLWYVNNISLILDVKILIYTIVKVFKSEGVNSSADLTMEPFSGNN